RPVAEQRDEEERRLARAAEELPGHRPHGEDRDEADGEFHPAAAIIVEQHEGARDQRDQQRRDQQKLGGELDAGEHSRRSRPSTWSVPVAPRAASSTTRNNAVVAKLMTIAVSTRACGTGSA